LMVGISLFITILGTMLGILIFEIRLQRKTLLEQETLDQLSFAAEYMGRSLRMAAKDEEGSCLGPTSPNYENPGGDPSIIRFLNHLQDDDCQEFFLDGTVLKYRKGIGASEEIFNLSPPKLGIQTLQFILSGGPPDDNLQPRVTISLETISEELPYPISFQTTISQRNLDKE